MESRRISLTHYRPGSATSATITPAWLRVIGPATLGSEINSLDDERIGIAAEILISRGESPMVGDLFRTNEGRLFVCRQIVPIAGQIKCLVGEFRSILPDEFDSYLTEQWWTVSGTWTPWPGQSTIGLTLPSATKPSGAGSLTQSCSGNFDVWCYLDSPAGSGANTYRAGLIASFTDVVLCGVRRTGTIEAVRVDEVGGVATENAVTLVSAPNYFRLKRRGANILCFYSAIVPPLAPSFETDWVLIAPPATMASSSAAASVGIGGYRSGAAASADFHFVRNWA